jgi:glyceraldehyde 3-phosphate dehydrogenase
MAKVAINGMGRIGRAALKVIMEQPEFELVAVNDIADIHNIAYLIKYDSVYGVYEHSVEVEGGNLIIGGKVVRYLSERDPLNLPWSDMGIDITFESTGLFTKSEDAGKHIQAGSKFVIISGPSSSADVPTVVYGVNTSAGMPSENTRIISCASCTTNNITPVMEVFNRRIGVKKAIMTTVHAYTATQMLVDAPGGKKDMRRGRAAAMNIVPSSTGAAVATTKALPELAGKFDGTSLRVPTPVGSVADITILTERPTSVEEIQQIFREEAATDRYKGILEVTDDAIVSSDIIKNPAASIFSLDLVQVVDGDLVKVMTWYDNEWGYTNQMVKQGLEVLAAMQMA